MCSQGCVLWRKKNEIWLVLVFFSRYKKVRSHKLWLQPAHFQFKNCSAVQQALSSLCSKSVDQSINEHKPNCGHDIIGSDKSNIAWSDTFNTLWIPPSCLLPTLNRTVFNVPTIFKMTNIFFSIFRAPATSTLIVSLLITQRQKKSSPAGIGISDNKPGTIRQHHLN